MSDRYARQRVLPEVGPDGQARLAAASVLVVGAGGLGCPVLQYLGGAGVGHLTVVDHDTSRRPISIASALCDGRHRQAEGRDRGNGAQRFNPTIAAKRPSSRA